MSDRPNLFPAWNSCNLFCVAKHEFNRAYDLYEEAWINDYDDEMISAMQVRAKWASNIRNLQGLFQAPLSLDPEVWFSITESIFDQDATALWSRWKCKTASHRNHGAPPSAYSTAVYKELLLIDQPLEGNIARSLVGYKPVPDSDFHTSLCEALSCKLDELHTAFIAARDTEQNAKDNLMHTYTEVMALKNLRKKTADMKSAWSSCKEIMHRWHTPPYKNCPRMGGRWLIHHTIPPYTRPSETCQGPSVVQCKAEPVAAHLPNTSEFICEPVRAGSVESNAAGNTGTSSAMSGKSSSAKIRESHAPTINQAEFDGIVLNDAGDNGIDTDGRPRPAAVGGDNPTSHSISEGAATSDANPENDTNTPGVTLEHVKIGLEPAQAEADATDTDHESSSMPPAVFLDDEDASADVDFFLDADDGNITDVDSSSKASSVDPSLECARAKSPSSTTAAQKLTTPQLSNPHSASDMIMGNQRSVLGVPDEVEPVANHMASSATARDGSILTCSNKRVSGASTAPNSVDREGRRPSTHEQSVRLGVDSWLEGNAWKYPALWQPFRSGKYSDYDFLRSLGTLMVDYSDKVYWTNVDSAVLPIFVQRLQLRTTGISLQALGQAVVEAVKSNNSTTSALGSATHTNAGKKKRGNHYELRCKKLIQKLAGNSRRRVRTDLIPPKYYTGELESFLKQVLEDVDDANQYGELIQAREKLRTSKDKRALDKFHSYFTKITEGNTHDVRVLMDTLSVIHAKRHYPDDWYDSATNKRKRFLDVGKYTHEAPYDINMPLTRGLHLSARDDDWVQVDVNRLSCTVLAHSRGDITINIAGIKQGLWVTSAFGYIFAYYSQRMHIYDISNNQEAEVDIGYYKVTLSSCANKFTLKVSEGELEVCYAPASKQVALVVPNCKVAVSLKNIKITVPEKRAKKSKKAAAITSDILSDPLRARTSTKNDAISASGSALDASLTSSHSKRERSVEHDFAEAGKKAKKRALSGGRYSK